MYDFPEKGVLQFASRKDFFVKSNQIYGVSKLFLMYGIEEIARIAKGGDGW